MKRLEVAGYLLGQRAQLDVSKLRATVGVFTSSGHRRDGCIRARVGIRTVGTAPAVPSAQAAARTTW